MAQDPKAENWQAVLDSGDRTAFRKLVEPYMDVLLKAARHDLNYYVAQGHLQKGDLTAEEVTGEALIYAWDHRPQRPDRMSLQGWLLGTQYRVLRGVVRQEKGYREDKAVSLDAPLPLGEDADATQEWFWDWYQPDVQINWEDVIPSQEPVDYEVPLYHNRATFTLDPDSRHVLMMHDEFEMSLPEVAFTMGRAVNETAELLEQARASLRERMAEAEEPPGEDVTDPAPPEGSDA